MAKRASDPVPITRPAVLAVEGDDEFYLLVELCQREGLRDSIHLHNLDGRDGLTEKVEALAESDGFADVKALGVMLDGEGAPAAQVEEATRKVVEAVFAPQDGDDALPGALLPRPERVSVFVAEQCLEDMCLRPAPVREAEAMRCVDAYLECLASLVDDTTPGQASKRRAYAYLASREQPGLRIGQAAYAGYWHFDDRVWTPLKAFLRDLAFDA